MLREGAVTCIMCGRPCGSEVLRLARLEGLDGAVRERGVSSSCECFVPYAWRQVICRLVVFRMGGGGALRGYCTWGV